jgi:hypothetical protein
MGLARNAGLASTSKNHPPSPHAPQVRLPQQNRPIADSASGIYRLFFLFQKRNDDSDSLLGLLLHDPVPRIVDDRTANIGSGKADFRR